MDTGSLGEHICPRRWARHMPVYDETRSHEPLNERGKLNQAKISISIEVDGNLVKILTESLLPEIERPSSSRSRVSLEPLNGRLELRISASDVTALRATVNSYLRWVDSILNLLDRID